MSKFNTIEAIHEYGNTTFFVCNNNNLVKVVILGKTPTIFNIYTDDNSAWNLTKKLYKIQHLEDTNAM